MTFRTVPISRLHEVLIYEPAAGRLTWRISPANNIKVGDPAGSRDGSYVRVSVDDVKILAHRVIFAMMTGRWPTTDVDHDDGDGLNNRWLNLREATESQNGGNSRLSKASRTGFKGVSRDKKAFQANITFKRKRIYIGSFSTPEAAHAAYLEKARELFGEFARAA